MRISVLSSILCLVGLAGHAVAQQATEPLDLLPAANSSSSASLASSTASQDDSLTPCNAFRLQTDKKLTFKQRVCFSGQPLITPQFALQAAVMSGFSELRRMQHSKTEGLSDYPVHFANYYARHAAKNAGEMMAGYLHHEDPRLRTSNQHGFLRRTSAAFASVVVAKDFDGNSKMAFAPIAGALSSGLVSMDTTRREATFGGGLHRAGFVYSTYFIKALVREYKPEISSYAHKLHLNFF